MASSGTYTWNPSTYSIITGSLRLLSAIQTGEIPPDDEYQDALDALNGLTKHWQASGIHVWAEQDCTLFFQPGQYQYQLGQVSPDICCLCRRCLQLPRLSLQPARCCRRLQPGYLDCLLRLVRRPRHHPRRPC